jgi:anti-sigma B factor antagonist
MPMDQEPSFGVERSRRGEAVVVAPTGEIDLATVDAVREQILAARGEASRVVLDLRGVDFLDSTGLRLIVEAQRDAEQEGWALVVVRAREPVQRLLDIAGLSSRLTVVDDPAEAAGGEPGGRA